MLVEHVCKQVIGAGSAAQNMLVVPPRTLVVSLQRCMSKEGPFRTTQNLADALLVLANQSSEALGIVLSVAKEMRDRSVKIMQSLTGLPNLPSLSPCLVTLLALCNR